MRWTFLWSLYVWNFSGTWELLSVNLNVDSGGTWCQVGFGPAAPNDPEALVARAQAFQAVGEKWKEELVFGGKVTLLPNA